jgi:hypothetical protein
MQLTDETPSAANGRNDDKGTTRSKLDTSERVTMGGG